MKCEIEIEDINGWLELYTDYPWPKDRAICAVLHRYGHRTPEIYQFRKADWLHKEGDYFLDVSEAWRMMASGGEEFMKAEWEPGFLSPNCVEYWKPLDLPEKEELRLKRMIESWFEE